MYQGVHQMLFTSTYLLPSQCNKALYRNRNMNTVVTHLLGFKPLQILPRYTLKTYSGEGCPYRTTNKQNTAASVSDSRVDKSTHLTWERHTICLFA